LRRIAEGELVVVPRVYESEVSPTIPEPKPAPRPEPIGPPVKRKPGRPILNREAIEAPADWNLTPVADGERNAA